MEIGTREQAARLEERGNAGFVYLISAVAALGGLLFGFDTAVVNGAMGFMKAQFHFDANQEGFMASCALLGCAAGAGFAGALADRFGRKKALLLAAVFFAVSGIGAALPRGTTDFIFWRLVGGLGIGIASMLSPLYIAEVAPARIRGSLVSCNQFAIISGILMAYLVNWACVRIFGEADTSQAWRWMFGFGTLPALLLFGALLAVPESPRWLIKQGRTREGLHILTRVGGRAHAEAEMAEIQAAVASEGGSIVELLRPGLRLALVVGVMLAVFQQITGINTVLYYSSAIFEKAGLAKSSAMISTVGVGLINGLFTIAAIALVDRVGRKPLLIVGAAGMGLSIMGVARVFQTQASGMKVMLALMAYVASFALTLGPVVWVVISEIFPTRIRGRGMSVATVILWLSCFVVSKTFPKLVESRGIPFTYYLYAAICFVMIAFVLALVPETKGKTLEEIERRFMK